jgi:hypothetical protein
MGVLTLNINDYVVGVFNSLESMDLNYNSGVTHPKSSNQLRIDSPRLIRLCDICTPMIKTLRVIKRIFEVCSRPSLLDSLVT